MYGHPYPATFWPAGADKAHYLDVAARGYPAASAETVVRIAQAAAMLDRGTKHFRSVEGFTKAVPHSRHGFAIIDAEAA